MPRSKLMADLLHEALESFLEQQRVDLELIVIDDGSSDDTGAVVTRYLSDGRLRYTQQAKQGRARARNHGANLARSQYFAFLDSDDRFLPGGLAAHWRILSDLRAPGVTSEGTKSSTSAGSTLVSDGRSKRATWGCPPGSSTVSACQAPRVVARSWFEQVGGFDPACGIAEDWDLFLRLAYAGCPMAWVPANVCQYRHARAAPDAAGPEPSPRPS